MNKFKITLNRTELTALLHLLILPEVWRDTNEVACYVLFKEKFKKFIGEDFKNENTIKMNRFQLLALNDFIDSILENSTGKYDHLYDFLFKLQSIQIHPKI